MCCFKISFFHRGRGQDTTEIISVWEPGLEPDKYQYYNIDDFNSFVARRILISALFHREPHQRCSHVGQAEQHPDVVHAAVLLQLPLQHNFTWVTWANLTCTNRWDIQTSKYESRYFLHYATTFTRPLPCLRESAHPRSHDAAPRVAGWTRRAPTCNPTCKTPRPQMHLWMSSCSEGTRLTHKAPLALTLNVECKRTMLIKWLLLLSEAIQQKYIHFQGLSSNFHRLNQKKPHYFHTLSTSLTYINRGH